MLRDGTARKPSRGLLALVMTMFLVSMAAPAAVGATPTTSGTRTSAPTSAAPKEPKVSFIVRYKDHPGKAQKDKVKGLGGSVTHELTLIDGLAVELPRGQAKQLKSDPDVAAIEADHPLVAFSDPPDLEYDNAWGVSRIGSQRVHLTGNTGQGVKVAVIDTGLDYIHDDPDDQPYVVDPEFTWHYKGGYDFYNNDADPMDDNGHGTHVSGILAANHNGYLVVGAAPDADLYALKVLSANGEGDYSGLIAALGWAVDHDIDVVNMSLGGHEASSALQAAIAAAYDAGVTLVAASGNVNPGSLQELLYGCPVAYPAAYDQVYAVSFTNTADKLTGFSCTGPQVDFAAPGDQIFSPVPVGSCMFCSPYGYAALSGTSMASPHVAGVAALVIHAGIADGNGDGLIADDIKAHLCANTSPAAGMATTDSRYPKWYGCGIIDADKALVDFPPPPPTTSLAAVADTATVDEDGAIDIPVLANDTDATGGPITLTGVSAPAHGSATANPDGTVHYTPVADYHGQDTFSYTIQGGGGATASGNVTVTVNAVNDPPVAGPDSASTATGIAVSIPVLANDTDVDGDSLAVTAVSTPANGSAAIGPGSAVTYTPNPGFDGTDAFTYDISDGAGGTATGSVSVSVVSTNTPPVAVDDGVSTPEDTPLTFDPAGNDTDVDGGPLHVTAVSSPAHGTAAIAVDGRVIYTPAADYHGSDSFDYVVADPVGATDSGSVSIIVTPVNDPPVAVDDAATTAEDTAVTIDVLGNDTDVDGDTLSLAGVGAPALGTAVAQLDGSVLYTPPADYNGSDTFDYTVSDGAGGTDTGSVTVEITASNDVPTADPKTATTAYQTATTITMSGADVETCDLTFQVVTPPAHGTLGSPSNVLCVTLLPPYSDSSKISYTPASGYWGADSFTYRVSDGTSWSPPATVSITVTAPKLLHVGDLDPSKRTRTTTWLPIATITVHDGSHAIVSGVTVTGTWSAGFTGSASCKTGSKGTCQVSPPAYLAKSVASVTFTVTGMSAKASAYDASANHDPETDSNGTTIVIPQ